MKGNYLVDSLLNRFAMKSLGHGTHDVLLVSFGRGEVALEVRKSLQHGVLSSPLTLEVACPVETLLLGQVFLIGSFNGVESPVLLIHFGEVESAVKEMLD